MVTLLVRKVLHYFKWLFLIVICSKISGCKDQSSYFILKNGTLIDCASNKLLDNYSLVIKDSLIFKIDKFENIDIPNNATVIDAKGKYIMPGLIDFHAHTTILKTENATRVYDRKTSEKVLKLLLQHGITTVRNPAAPTKDGLQLKHDVLSGKITGPDIYTSGEAIQMYNGKKSDLWETHVSDETEAITEVNRQIDEGVDFIKIYSSVPENIVKVIIETAHKRQVNVCGHLSATSWLKATELGIDIFEHATDWHFSLLPKEHRSTYKELIKSHGAMKARIKWLEWIDPDGAEMAALLKSIKARKSVIGPTLIAYATKFMGDDTSYTCNHAMNRVPELVSDWEKGTFVDDWTKQDFEAGHKQWNKVLALVKKYYENGIRMVIGSDLPNPWVIPGISLYQEMQLMSQANIPNYEILKMCTINAAEALNISDKKGSLQVGKYADIIVLDKNPIADIQNIRTIQTIFKKGKNISK